MHAVSVSRRCGSVLLLASIIGSVVSCSGDRAELSSAEGTVDKVLNSATTNQLVALPDHVGCISVVELPRPRHVFYEGAYRALVISHGDDVSYYPFPQSSAGDRTHVDVYHIVHDVYFLRDATRKRSIDLILDLGKGVLFYLATAEGRSFIYSVAESPSPSLENALQPNDLSTISVSVFHPAGAEQPVVRIGQHPLRPLPEEYAGPGTLVGTITPEGELSGERSDPKGNGSPMKSMRNSPKAEGGEVLPTKLISSPVSKL